MADYSKEELRELDQLAASFEFENCVQRLDLNGFRKGMRRKNRHCNSSHPIHELS
ncbi:uncharacterized protein RAG0_10704 [Rhynchosporium agropyri]|uniref:Uncharacterized protein n=1 Tax=Rhynchosporium agropyri TaxID=914238 RepID=A0A1E1L0W0_9HELO|nr:uncharacterized protein RAG0_10704 [Rhynchosporium agropyri]